MPKLNDSPVKQPSEQQQARAAERARLAQMVESEYQPPEEVGDPPPEEPPPEEPPPQEEEEVEEEPPVVQDEVQEPPKRSRSEVWKAIKAQDERFKIGLENLSKTLDERLNSLINKFEEVRPKPPPEEIDPEVAAWEEALKEGVTKHVSPELSAFKQQQFLDKVELSIEIARAKHKDFDELVGDIWDPANPLMAYLQSNDGDSKQIFTSRNIGEALRNKAIFLKEGTAEARESWRKAEIEKLRKENEAFLAAERKKLLDEFKGVVAKGQSGNPLKPTSIAGESNGTAGDDPNPIKAALSIPDKHARKKALEDLVRRGEAGEVIS